VTKRGSALTAALVRPSVRAGSREVDGSRLLIADGWEEISSVSLPEVQLDW
jgi:hypothetical protein